MTYIQTWGEVFTNSLQRVWSGVENFVPNLVIAIIILAIGWILAVLVERLVEHLFKALKVDTALRSAGLEDVVERAGHKLNSGLFVGALVKWFIIVVFLMSSFEVLGLTQFSIFLNQVVGYLPQVIVAVLILMVAMVVGNTMERIVIASSKATNVRSAEMLGHITRWTIWIFAILTALFNLGIAPSIIQTVITAVFAGAALALGLAFGLGGKDYAQKILEKTMKRWEN
jgi:small-conductance mechanosensitive channel